MKAVCKIRAFVLTAALAAVFAAILEEAAGAAFEEDFWGAFCEDFGGAFETGFCAGLVDDLPAGLDYLVYDFAVNAGPGQSAKILQRAVGVTDDGAIGNGTLAAVRSHNAQELIEEFTKRKEEFYHSIVAKRPENERFLKGWLNRVAHVKDVAENMVA